MDPRRWNFDVDRYVNRFVPCPPWHHHHVPWPIARFLGYRADSDKPKESGNLVPIFWAFIGVFCGLAVIMAVDMHVQSFNDRSAPLIIGSFVSALSGSSHRRYFE